MNPQRWSFGSAPASSKTAASSKWPFSTASINGVVPRAGALPVDRLGCMAWLTSAPAFSRIRTTVDAALAYREEQGREPGGERPSGNQHRLSSNASTTAACPSAAAHIRAV